MKKSLISALILSALFAISFSFQSCSPNNPAQTQSSNIPALLNRTAGLGSDEERQWVQNTYVDLRNQILEDSTRTKPKLRLAELFIMEARATGEHGHYYPAAQQVLASIMRNQPSDDERFQTLSLQASVTLSLHQFDEALVIANEAVNLNPYNAQIYGALVDAHVELGEYEQAVAMADKMVSIRPDLRSYSRVSYLREIFGQTEGAIKAMQMAVSAGYPGAEDWAWSKLTLGQLFENYGGTQQARREYQEILAVRENYPFAMAALGRLAAKENNYADAEKWLLAAAQLIPEVSFYEELTAIYQEQGKNEMARSTSLEILEMLKDDEASGHKMGLAYAELYLSLLNEPAKALPFAEQELNVRPQNIEVNLMLARIYDALGQTERAREHLLVAQRTGSKTPQLAALSTKLSVVAEL